jgi:hypothetical protein
MVTLITGASIANAAGLTTFNMQAITQCLHDTMREQRANLSSQSYNTMSDAEDAESVLAEMMADLRGINLLYTDVVPQAAGRPVPVVPMFVSQLERLRDVWMQVGQNDGRILARKSSFDNWLRDHGHNTTQVMKLLGKQYYIKERKARIGVVVPMLDVGEKRTHCWDMTPRDPPAQPSHTPAGPSSSFGSP